MSTTARRQGVDVLRGLAMVLMALDHVRVFSGVPAGGPTPGVFFTRWVTHFCAPAFVFLAGTSAFLQQGRREHLSRHLALRGAWLIVLELTLVRLGWTFNLDFGGYELAGVLWVIGWSMIALAALRKLPVAAIAAFGLGVIALHNLLDGHQDAAAQAFGAHGLGWLWTLLYGGPAGEPIDAGTHLFVLYTLVPWVGVMAAGYAFGAVLALEPARRDRLCRAIGAAAIALFLLLRATSLYGDPRPYTGAHGPAWLAFLNPSKYPASLEFLLMTLGPTLLVLPLAERVRGGVSRGLALFGRVPLFYYVLHIPLVHALAALVSLVREGRVDPWLFTNHPVANPPAPEGYRWNLLLLYAVWLVALGLLWPACRWFAAVKERAPAASWLRRLS